MSRPQSCAHGLRSYRENDTMLCFYHTHAVSHVVLAIVVHRGPSAGRVATRRARSTAPLRARAIPYLPSRREEARRALSIAAIARATNQPPVSGSRRAPATARAPRLLVYFHHRGGSGVTVHTPTWASHQASRTSCRRQLPWARPPVGWSDGGTRSGLGRNPLVATPPRSGTETLSSGAPLVRKYRREGKGEV